MPACKQGIHRPLAPVRRSPRSPGALAPVRRGCLLGGGPIPFMLTPTLKQCPSCARRTRRLEAVKQLGVDRIVQLTFGSGAAACHLLLEFYAQAGPGRRRCLRCQHFSCGRVAPSSMAQQSRPPAASAPLWRRRCPVSAQRRARPGLPGWLDKTARPPRSLRVDRRPLPRRAPQGNVILADDKFEVLTLLRSHRQAP